MSLNASKEAVTSAAAELASVERSNPEWKKKAEAFLLTAHLENRRTASAETRALLKAAISPDDATKIQHAIGDSEDGVIGRGDIKKIQEEVEGGHTDSTTANTLGYPREVTEPRVVETNGYSLDPSFLKIVSDNGKPKSIENLSKILAQLDAKADTDDKWEYMKQLGYEDYGLLTRASTQVRVFSVRLSQLIENLKMIQQQVDKAVKQAKLEGKIPQDAQVQASNITVRMIEDDSPSIGTQLAGGRSSSDRSVAEIALGTVTSIPVLTIWFVASIVLKTLYIPLWAIGRATGSHEEFPDFFERPSLSSG